jgi:hypothetical protein
VHRHQFDHVHAEVDQMVQPRRHSVEGAGEAAHVQLVHHRVGVARGELLAPRPRPAEHAEGGAVVEHHHIGSGRVDQRTHTVGDQPVVAAVVGLDRGVPVPAVALHRHALRLGVWRCRDEQVEFRDVRGVHAHGTDGSHGVPAWQPP